MSKFGWRTTLVLIGFLAIAAFFLLLSEHKAHLFGILPYLLLLTCPLLHWLMHGGQGGHSQNHDKGGQGGRK